MQYSSISWTHVPHQFASSMHMYKRNIACIQSSDRPTFGSRHSTGACKTTCTCPQALRVCLRNLQLVISRRLTGAAEASARVASCCGSRLWFPAHSPFVASGSCSSSRPTALLVAGPCSSSRSTALLVAGKAVELLPRGYGCRSGGASRFVHCGRA